MSALVATSALERWSWIVTIVAFALGITQLVMYWFGRLFRLSVRADEEDTLPTEKGDQLKAIRVVMRSRTRETQTVRDMVLLRPPVLLVRLVWPWWTSVERAATLVDVVVPALPIEINGHDTREVRISIARLDLPYGGQTRLSVTAGRRRPHVVRIHEQRKADAVEPGKASEPPEVSPAG